VVEVTLSMRWRDLLFAHWAVDPAVVAERLPAGVEVATYDGDAYLGVVPFVMDDIRPAGLPIGRSFPELNLRTYVDRDGQRGVYFFSLDASDRLAVSVARRRYRLPYYRADLRVTSGSDNGVAFAGHREHADAPPAHFDATYRPTGEPFRADPGSLVSFLTENYAFFAAGDRLYRGLIDHDPWTLRPATVDVRTESLFAANGFDHPDGDPICHYAEKIDVAADRLEAVDRP
jgi:hypothetical protein